MLICMNGLCKINLFRFRSCAEYYHVDRTMDFRVRFIVVIDVKVVVVAFVRPSVRCINTIRDFVAALAPTPAPTPAPVRDPVAILCPPRDVDVLGARPWWPWQIVVQHTHLFIAHSSTYHRRAASMSILKEKGTIAFIVLRNDVTVEGFCEGNRCFCTVVKTNTPAIVWTNRTN